MRVPHIPSRVKLQAVEASYQLAELVARQLSAYAPRKCVETQQYPSMMMVMMMMMMMTIIIIIVIVIIIVIIIIFIVNYIHQTYYLLQCCWLNSTVDWSKHLCVLVIFHMLFYF